MVVVYVHQAIHRLCMVALGCPKRGRCVERIMASAGDLGYLSQLSGEPTWYNSHRSWTIPTTRFHSVLMCFDPLPHPEIGPSTTTEAVHGTAGEHHAICACAMFIQCFELICPFASRLPRPKVATTFGMWKRVESLKRKPSTSVAKTPEPPWLLPKSLIPRLGKEVRVPLETTSV